MQEDETQQPADDGRARSAEVERGVRPCAYRLRDAEALAWLYYSEEELHNTAKATLAPLYDQAALDAALALWPRDCRLCAKFTTQTGGCTSTAQCVDSDQYKATAPRQYWVSGPNA